MKNLPALAPTVDVSRQFANVCHDAASAEKYARKLREFYMANMDAPIRKADLKLAARLSTLIFELTCAASRTNTRINRLAKQEVSK